MSDAAALRSEPDPPPLDPEVEAVLRDPAALWATAQQASGEYIAVVDRHGIIRACNRVDEGFSVDQVIGQSFVRFTVPESTAALEEKLRDVFVTGELQSLETTVRRLDGTLNYFSLRIAPVARHGRTVAALACCESIRPLKETEAELRRERNVLRRLIEVQERERQLVSYEIHDGLAQYLVAALLHLQACQETCPPAAAEDFAASLRLLQAATEESRRLIGGLRPPALDELGMVDAIDSLVADARADIGDVSFAHALTGTRLPPQLETTVFRIVQEAITNARKHSRAARLRVSVQQSAGQVRIRVEDDGCGFDPARVPEERFGLEGIRQRSRLFGAEPRITSAPGAGTSIAIDLDVPPA